MPNLFETIPEVGGTVDNHKRPNVVPKIIELIIEGGEKIKMLMLIALSA